MIDWTSILAFVAIGCAAAFLVSLVMAARFAGRRREQLGNTADQMAWLPKLLFHRGSFGTENENERTAHCWRLLLFGPGFFALGTAIM